jgi:hypothetical protein
MTMTTRSVVALFVATAGLFAATSVHSIDVSILDAKYSTDLSYGISGSSLALSATSPTPINYLFQAGVLGPTTPFASTSASANLFSVSAATTAFSGFAKASADSVLSFSSLSTSAAPLTLDFLAGGTTLFTSGLVSLFDVTSNTSVFSYSWERLGASTIPGFPGGEMVLALDPELYAAHDYKLSMHVASDASNDSENASIRLSGFHPVVAAVPEPETYALMLAGLVLMRSVVRARKAKR